MHIEFHDSIYVVSNYEYSPFLKKLTETNNNVDKEDINGTTIYIMDELENIMVTPEQLIGYISYLSNGKIKYQVCNLVLFDYMGHNVNDLISLNDTRRQVIHNYIEYYIVAKLEDTWIRDNMYKMSLYEHDPLYGLHKSGIVNMFNVVDDLNTIFEGIEYYIAGGYPLYLYNKNTKRNIEFSDVDLFFCNDNCEKALLRLLDQDKKLSIMHVSPNSITFKHNKIKYQVILRRYKAPTEIVHGFDVDCCGAIIHNNTIYMTSRAKVSNDFHINMFDYTRMSESYPYRMKKYKDRGYDVHFPQTKLVDDIIRKYEALLVNYVSLNNNNLANVNMSEVYNRQDYWKEKLRKYGMELTIENMLKIGKLRTKGYVVHIRDLNSSALSIFLTSKYNIKVPKVSDYKGKGIIKIENIKWKEQDPMTQVTSTFNPEIYTSFEEFIEQHNLDILKDK